MDGGDFLFEVKKRESRCHPVKAHPIHFRCKGFSFSRTLTWYMLLYPVLLASCDDVIHAHTIKSELLFVTYLQVVVECCSKCLFCRVSQYNPDSRITRTSRVTCIISIYLSKAYYSALIFNTNSLQASC